MTQNLLNNACKQELGITYSYPLGGKVSPEFGKPVQVEAKVLALSEGEFHNSGPFNQHLKVNVKGAAHIRVGNGYFVHWKADISERS